jgi:hypothetical protein
MKRTIFAFNWNGNVDVSSLLGLRFGSNERRM